MVWHDTEALGQLGKNALIVVIFKHGLLDLSTLVGRNFGIGGEGLEIGQVFCRIWLLSHLVNQLALSLCLHVHERP